MDTNDKKTMNFVEAIDYFKNKRGSLFNDKTYAQLRGFEKGRVFKFRAWSNELNEMSNVFRFNQVLSFKSGNVKSITDEIIMQYTGLVDTNGIEVYEGDIVKFTRGSGSWALPGYKVITDICIVIWDDERCGFNIKYRSNVQKLSNFKHTRYVYEVIGNVNKDKHLIPLLSYPDCDK